MARRAAWILVLLVALLIVSASAVFAAGVTLPAQSATAAKLGVNGNTKISTLYGWSGGKVKMTKMKSDFHTHCHLADEEAAY